MAEGGLLRSDTCAECFDLTSLSQRSSSTWDLPLEALEIRFRMIDDHIDGKQFCRPRVRRIRGELQFLILVWWMEVLEYLLRVRYRYE